MLRTRKNALFPTSVCCWLIVLESCRITPPAHAGKTYRRSYYYLKGSDHPAHAGKTYGQEIGRRCITDHPRTCGENSIPKSTEPGPFGSPPHMRGKPILPCQDRSIFRITPAHAGKTIHCICAELLTPDHPRTCGENCISLRCALARLGSPPHMRGKPFDFCIQSGTIRITPAHAGKTRSGGRSG